MTDAERDAAVKVLTRHCGEGRLTLDELEDRIGEVYAAATPADLRHALRELPPFRDEPAPADPAQHASDEPMARTGCRRAAPARRCGAGGMATAPAVLIALTAILFATSHVVLAILVLVLLVRRTPARRRLLLHA